MQLGPWRLLAFELVAVNAFVGAATVCAVAWLLTPRSRQVCGKGLPRLLPRPVGGCKCSTLAGLDEGADDRDREKDESESQRRLPQRHRWQSNRRAMTGEYWREYGK